MALLPSPIEQIHDPLFESRQVKVYFKRDDLIHPYVMGNKWRKLKYNVKYAKENGFLGILTIGGAYSNHIAATAACCQENGFQSIGIIRGDELNEQSNATLRFASSQGMGLQFVSRQQFREIKANFDDLQRSYPAYYCLPEGGTNERAIRGCEEIVREIEMDFDYITCAVGTGGTLAGIISGLGGEKEALGFPALKGGFVEEELNKLLKSAEIPFSNYQLISSFHFGGYGKVPPELVAFINEVKKQTGIPLDPIYTGKMVFGLKTLIEEDFFKPGSRIIALHTGGLQGIEGFNESQKQHLLL